MSKLLFVGDFGVQTGFARGNEHVVRALQKDHQVHVIGINATGDPNPGFEDVLTYPASHGGDAFGVGRMAELNEKVKPDVIVLVQDSWNVALYLQQLPETHAPVIAWCPVDAPHQWAAPTLKGCALVATPTLFGVTELQNSGYHGPTTVIPYGVDTSVYRPLPRAEARRGFSQEADKRLRDGYVTQVVGRNTTRKRQDLVLEYWRDWWEASGRKKDSYLMLHCNVRDAAGYDLMRIATYLGVEKQLILTSPSFSVRNCLTQEQLVRVYNTADVHLGLAHEGFGLCTAESMACGVPQICIDYAALGEWPRGVVSYVAVSDTYFMSGPIATVAPVPDRVAVGYELRRHYDMSPADRSLFGAACARRMRETRFSWGTIGNQWRKVVQGVLND